MKKESCIISLLFLFCFSNNQLIAQEDKRTWLSSTYEILESNKSSLELSQRLRWKSEVFNVWISELDFKTDLGKGFSSGLELRYQIEKDRSGAIQGNRASGRIRGNLYHKFDLGRFEIRNRMGLQYKQRLDDRSDEFIFRFRPQITPKIKNFKYDPSIRVEYFKNLNRSSDHSVRYGIKIPIQMGRNHLEFGYFFEKSSLKPQSNRNVIFLNHKLSK